MCVALPKGKDKAYGSAGRNTRGGTSRKILHIWGEGYLLLQATLNSRAGLSNIAHLFASCLPACESTRSSKPANNWSRVAQTLWETRLMRALAGLFAFQQAIQLHHECNHFVRVFFHTDSLCDISPITRLWGHGKPPFYFCVYSSYSGSETKSEQFCSPESKLKLGQLGP